MFKWCVVFLACFCLIHADERSALAPQKPTICLNMIVKNEKKVIERCLGSVKDLIDYWVIVDTGSTDGTQQIIKDFMKDVPGELHEQLWVNFGHNRTEALKLTKNKADYILFIDADETLEFSKIKRSDFKKYISEKEAYLAPCIMPLQNETSLHRVLLVKNGLDWKWIGVLHERIVCSRDATADLISGVAIRADQLDGSRAQDPQKWQKDAALLEKAIVEDPDNREYVYYLAQSYYNIPMLDKALKTYEKRSQMGGFEQHVFWSLYMVARISEMLHYPQDTITSNYCKAYHNRPTRAEPLYHLAQQACSNQNWILGYVLAQYALKIPFPETDCVYVEKWIYDYGLLMVLANCSAKLEKNEETCAICQKLADMPTTPKDLRIQAQKMATILMPASVNN